MRDDALTRARRKRQENAGRENGQHTRDSGGEDYPEERGQSVGKIARASSPTGRSRQISRKGRETRVAGSQPNAKNLGKPMNSDRELAMLYGVSTTRLNEAVKRNARRFPEDFMFRLTREEAMHSRSQIAKTGRGHNLKYLPHAFTEHGAIQARMC